MGEVIDINKKLFEKRHEYFLNRRDECINTMAQDIILIPHQWRRKYIDDSLNDIEAPIEKDNELAAIMGDFIREDIKVSLLQRFHLITEDDINTYQKKFEAFKQVLKSPEKFVLDYEDNNDE